MQKLVICIEKDQDIFLATIPSLNTHSTGKTLFDAMINITANVHNLYEQLNQDIRWRYKLCLSGDIIRDRTHADHSPQAAGCD